MTANFRPVTSAAVPMPPARPDRDESGNDPRYSPPMGLWCPYCRQPFVGRVDRQTGRFVHGTCPVAELDTALLDGLAEDSWFWARFRERLLGDGPVDGPATLAS